MEDRLDAMLLQQKELQKRLGYNFKEMSVEETVAYIKEYSIHLTQELHEAMYELPHFKPWKKYSEEDYLSRVNSARAEWIDVLHFFLNITIALGFDADKLFKDFEAKHTENYQRQQNTADYKKCVEASDAADSARET